jgi:hypothetical protein
MLARCRGAGEGESGACFEGSEGVDEEDSDEGVTVTWTCIGFVSGVKLEETAGSFAGLAEDPRSSLRLCRRFGFLLSFCADVVDVDASLATWTTVALSAGSPSWLSTLSSRLRFFSTTVSEARVLDICVCRICFAVGSMESRSKKEE